MYVRFYLYSGAIKPCFRIMNQFSFLLAFHQGLQTSYFRNSSFILSIDFEVSGRVWKVNIKLDTLFDAMSDTDRWVCMFSSWSKHQSNSSKVSTAVRIYVSSNGKIEWKICYQRYYIGINNCYFNSFNKATIILPGMFDRGVVTSLDGVRSCRFLLLERGKIEIFIQQEITIFSILIF